MAAAPFFLVLTYLSKVSTLATDHRASDPGLPPDNYSEFPG
jgi:hypothetical protein